MIRGSKATVFFLPASTFVQSTLAERTTAFSIPACYSVDVRLKEIQQLIPGGVNTYPSWSPDGKMIYFTNCKKSDFGVDCQVIVAPVDGG